MAPSRITGNRVSGEKDGRDQQRKGDPEEIHAAISATKIFQGFYSKNMRVEWAAVNDGIEKPTTTRASPSATSRKSASFAWLGRLRVEITHTRLI